MSEKKHYKSGVESRHTESIVYFSVDIIYPPLEVSDFVMEC